MRTMKFAVAGLSVIAMLTVGSCGLFAFFGNTLDSDTAVAPKFDLDSAAAVAISSLGGIRAISTDVEEFDGFVKILDDGRVVPAMDWGNDSSWKPVIAFLAKGADGSVYMAFDHNFSYFSQLLNGVVQAQFIRIHPDSSYDNTRVDVIWPPTDEPFDYDTTGQLETWAYSWMDQAPLVRGPNDSLYFKISRWSGYDEGHAIYRYNPADSSLERVTPENTKLYIDHFTVDGDGRLIFTESDWDTGETKMRFYTPGVDGFGTIFYSSGYVRSFATAPSGELYINGDGIQGRSGILKVNFTEGANTIDGIEVVYPTGLTWYSFVDYGYDYAQSGFLIETYQTGYRWKNSLLNDAGDAVNRDALLYIVQQYFLDPDAVTLAPALETYLSDNGTDLTVLLDDKSLQNWIEQYPYDFMKAYFEGSQLFQDYIDANPDLQGIYIGNIGNLNWLSDGTLVGVGSSFWWGGSDSSVEVITLLDPAGNKALGVSRPDVSNKRITMVKYVGDWMYFRLGELDSFGSQIGIHTIGAMNMLSGQVLPDLIPAVAGDFEVRSYDVADDNSSLYILGLDSNTNQAINGVVDLATLSWKELDAPYELSDITVIK